MQVYGDRTRAVVPSEALTRAAAAWTAAALDPPGIARHGRVAAVFIALGELLQGVGDEAPAAEPAFIGLTLAAAAALRASWVGGALPPCPFALFAAAAAAAPDRLSVKTAEGYAFYALYPEAYAEAAAALSSDTTVIGIRSIGAGLSCVVAEAAGAKPPLTVRPTGHPFARTVTLPELDPAGRFAVVDEGPGLSGSSFGAVADALAARGVPPDRTTFLPGHDGALGPEASSEHRARWAAARRLHVGFETLIAPRLDAWVRDLTGPVLEAHDLSGGAWRARTHAAERDRPPAAAHQERRKRLLIAESGPVLLKFVGLGEHGLAAFDRARALHAEGFAPEPLGWRHGFLVERWIEGRPADAGEIAAALPRYLERRAALFPTVPGASPDGLAAMARANVAEALGSGLAARIPPPPPQSPCVAGDHRLHAWEWRVAADGRVLKTDGVDHAFGHDLVGPQPAAWDIAGAVVEHGLELDVGPFWTVAYAAFQLGLWTMAAQALAGWTEERDLCAAQAERYAQALREALVTEPR